MNGGLGDDNGPNCCDPYADNIWGLSAIQNAGNVDAVTAECMAGPAGGSLDRTSDEATQRSLHPRGVNVVMADGSVHFISDFIETTGAWGGIGAVWDWLITSADGRVVDGKKVGF
jgi:prepilin-type processing-associated H-X9-DG protein